MTIPPALSNIPSLTKQTFPASCSPYTVSSSQSHHLPHTSAESPSTGVYGQPVYSTQVFHTQASPSVPWGRVCLYIPVPQDSGYGGDISVSRQYDTPCDKHHAQITSSPRIYSTPHIAACSFTHGQSPWNSALRVNRVRHTASSARDG